MHAIHTLNKILIRKRQVTLIDDGRTGGRRHKTTKTCSEDSYLH